MEFRLGPGYAVHALLHALHLALERELLCRVPVELAQRGLALRLLSATLLVHLAVGLGLDLGGTLGLGLVVEEQVALVRGRGRGRIRLGLGWKSRSRWSELGLELGLG